MALPKNIFGEELELNAGTEEGRRRPVANFAAGGTEWITPAAIAAMTGNMTPLGITAGQALGGNLGGIAAGTAMSSRGAPAGGISPSPSAGVSGWIPPGLAAAAGSPTASPGSLGIMKFAGVHLPDEVPEGQQEYLNLSGRSGVDTYEFAPGGVLKIRFKTGDKVYDYPNNAQLAQLALDGIYLNRRLNADRGRWG